MAVRSLEISSGNLTRLRPITREDLDDLYRWDQDEEVVKWSGSKFTNRKDCKDWYLKGNKLQRMVFGIETLSQVFIGELEIVNISWRLHTGEVRIVIGERDYWNKGYGTDALKTAVRDLFKTTGLRELVLRVDDKNHRAKRCYEKVGFRPLGKVSLKDGCTLILMRLRKDVAAD